MADASAATDAILDRITDDLKHGRSESVLRLAEAYAWIKVPNQSHGGASSIQVKSS